MPNVTVVPLDMVLGQQALELAAQHGLRGADAVYAVVAQRAACTLISLDNEHLTRLPDIVRVQTPEEALAELSPPPRGGSGLVSLLLVHDMARILQRFYFCVAQPCVQPSVSNAHQALK